MGLCKTLLWHQFNGRPDSNYCPCPSLPPRRKVAGVCPDKLAHPDQRNLGPTVEKGSGNTVCSASLGKSFASLPWDGLVAFIETTAALSQPRWQAVSLFERQRWLHSRWLARSTSSPSRGESLDPCGDDQAGRSTISQQTRTTTLSSLIRRPNARRLSSPRKSGPDRQATSSVEIRG